MSKKLFFTGITLMLTVTMSYAQFKMSAGKTDVGLRVGAVFLNTKKFSPYEKFNASSPAIGLAWETGLWNFGLSI